MDLDIFLLVKLKTKMNKQRMRNINVIHFVESNGRHQWLEKLMDLLDAKGFTQAFLTVDGPGVNHAYLAERFPGMKINKQPMGRVPSKKWISQMRQMRVDGSANIVFALGHPASIISAVTSLFLEFNFVLCHTQQPRYFEVMKWQAPLRMLLHQIAYRLYIRRASRVISLSREVAEVLIRHGIDNRKIIPVNFGMDFKKIVRQLNESDSSPRKMPGNPKILMVGRLSKEKNYKVAIEAFAIFLQTYPDATLSIAGEGPQREEISRLANALHIDKSIQFLGYVNNIPRLMTNFDVLLHLASTESYGQIYLEALLSRLPIICSRTGIAIDLVEMGEPNIRIVDSRSIQNVSQGLLNYFTQPLPLLHGEIGLFENFYRHEDDFVYQELALLFEGLGTRNV